MSARELTLAADVPLAPSDTENFDPRLVSMLRPDSFEADQYRMLRYAVERVLPNKSVRMIAVTSPIAGDGKTVTAVNLAATIAKAEQARVLLVDTDLRRPNVARVLGRTGQEHGWSLVDAILDRRQSLEHAAWRLEPFNLSIVTTRRPAVDTYELLASDRFTELVNAARERFDFVILDSAPVLPAPDCRLLAELIDGFLVVVAATKTPRRLLEETLVTLGPEKVLGLVFNREVLRQSRYSRYYYGYYHGGKK
jgi:capsular exopolysaccharide synthesis family protein